MSTLAEQVIAAFGGPTKVHRATGIPISTVDGWRIQGNIPSWRHGPLKEAAAREGIKLPRAFMKNGRGAA